MEALIPGYTDVWINEETCEIRKSYNTRPVSYICPDNKNIFVNLKSLPGKYKPNRINILAQYNKIFSKRFNGSIIAAGPAKYDTNNEECRDIFNYSTINGKIINQTLVASYKDEYFEKRTALSYEQRKPTTLGQTEYESLYRR
jgi:hypothetical protein